LIINCINIRRRTDRRQSAISEFNKVHASYLFWDGIEGGIPKTNISQAFKNIVRFAKNNDLDKIIIAEDDISFPHPKAYQHYLDNMPEDADLYLASNYADGAVHDENFVTTNFRGMTLVTVFKRYYDTFLGVAENRHIDVALTLTRGRFIMCYPYAATQYPGYSDQRKKYCDDSLRLKKKLIFGV